MKLISAGVLLLALTGCSLLPRAHDPVMFNQLVKVSIDIESVDCNDPDWSQALSETKQLARYAQWRSDPQSDNLSGLERHVARMTVGSSVAFCELGKKTATARIQAVKTSWENR